MFSSDTITVFSLFVSVSFTVSEYVGCRLGTGINVCGDLPNNRRGELGTPV